MYAWITLTEVGQRLADIIRNIVYQIIEVVTPPLTMLGIALIIFGLLLSALRQEWAGLRWITAGALILIMLYLVIPLLLPFI
jgi:hypothetical protein